MSPDAGSAIIAAVQATFAAAMLPTACSKMAQVPRASSGLTAAGLWVIAAVYIALDLRAAAFSVSATALVWTLVFWLRPTRRATWAPP